MTAATTTPAPRERLTRAGFLTVTVLLVSVFVVILNETTMNVALSRIIDDFGVTEQTAQWLVTGFLLTMAVIIPTTGWVMERFQTRTVYAAAMGAFVLGTAVAIFAPTFEVLLLARIIQAAGTALAFPLLVTTVMNVVPPSIRGMVMGNVSLVISCAPAIGPSLAAFILQNLNWRYIFVIVLPLAAIIMILGLRFIGNVGETSRPRLDVLSVPLAAFGFGGLVFALSLVGSNTAPAWALPTSAAVGAVSLVAFLLRQRSLQTTNDALLDLRTFRYRNFTLSVAMMAVAMMAMFGVIIALPLVLQEGLNFDVVVVGLLLLPGALLTGVLGPLVGRLYDKFGPTYLLVPGALIVMAGLGMFTTLNTGSSQWFFLACHVTMSLGFAFTFPVLFTVSLASLPHSLYGFGSAILGTVQQVGGATGTALFVTVLATQRHRLEGEGLSPTEAYIGGAHIAFLVAAGLWVVGVVLAFLIRRPADNIPDLPGHTDAERVQAPVATH